jgi:hypothetical protein
MVRHVTCGTPNPTDRPLTCDRPSKCWVCRGDIEIGETLIYNKSYTSKVEATPIDSYKDLRKRVDWLEGELIKLNDSVDLLRGSLTDALAAAEVIPQLKHSLAATKQVVDMLRDTADPLK